MGVLRASMPTRLFAGMLASALLAFFLLFVNPFPSDVHGQSPGAAAASSGTSTTTETLPVQIQTQRPPGQTQAPPSTTVQTQQRPPAITQQPVALPRTGTGLEADTPLSTTLLAFCLLAVSAALGSAGLVLHLSRRSR